MIYSLLLISKGGVPIYRKILRRLPLPDKSGEESLMAGILTAVMEMSKETFGQRIKALSFENLEVTLGVSDKAIIAIIADKGDPLANRISENLIDIIDKAIAELGVEEGLVISVSAEKLNTVITETIEKVAAPIVSVKKLVREMLSALRREIDYPEELEKIEAKTYSISKKTLSSILGGMLGKGTEQLYDTIDRIFSGNFIEALDILQEIMGGGFYGELSKGLFIKIGLLLNLFSPTIPAPPIEKIRKLINTINPVEERKFPLMKKERSGEEKEYLFLMKGILEAEFDSIAVPGAIFEEKILLKNITSDLEKIHSRGNETLLNIFTILAIPLLEESGISDILLEQVNGKSVFFETWASAIKIAEDIRMMEAKDWDSILSEFRNLQDKFFDTLKKDERAATFWIIPLCELLDRKLIFKNASLKNVEEFISIIFDLIHKEFMQIVIKNPEIPSNIILKMAYAIAKIAGMERFLSTEDTWNQKKDKIISALKEVLKKIRFYWAGNRIPIGIYILNMPKIVRYISRISEENAAENLLSDIIYTIIPFLNMNDKDLDNIAKEEPLLWLKVMESILETTYKLAGYLRKIEEKSFLKTITDNLEMIAIRYGQMGVEADSCYSIILDIYARLIRLSDDDKEAQEYLLKAVTLYDDFYEKYPDKLCLEIKESMLNVYISYIDMFGPLVPRWNKPVKLCNELLSEWRDLKGSEHKIAEIWKTCRDLERKVS
ncbi:MAG: hypothetical protein ACTSVW_05205 [Candidatus Njordarchaeales archaeon]